METALVEGYCTHLKSPCGENQAFNFVVFLICFEINHVQIQKSAPLLSIFSLNCCSEPKTVSKSLFENVGVSDVTNHLVTN